MQYYCRLIHDTWSNPVEQMANVQTEAQPKQIISACMLNYKEVSMSCISVPLTEIINRVIKRGRAMDTKKEERERQGRKALTL